MRSAFRIAGALAADLIEFGQQLAARSLPVVLASDQPAVPVTGSVSLGGAVETISSDMRSAFGEPVTVQVGQVASISFPYGLSPDEVFTMGSGATFATNGDGVAPATTNGCDMLVSIGAAARSFAVGRMLHQLHYRAGLSMEARWTANFPAGVADQLQFSGLWNGEAAYGVARRNGVWGCLAQTGGARAIYTLTVTAGAVAANNVTITLDGTAVVVAVTNVGAPATTATAWEIARGVYTAAGATTGSWGWSAYAVGATVYFVARRALAVAGAFTFNAGATGATATGPTEIRRGQDEVFSFGSPATPGNFTFHDALDGTGPSGVALNKELPIIYALSAGHLGHRGFDLFAMNPATRRMIWVATYDFYNTSLSSALQNPTMALTWMLVSNGSVQARTMYAGSGFIGMAGAADPHEGVKCSARATRALTNGQAIHVVSVRASAVAGFGGQVVRSSQCELHVHRVSVAITGGGAGATAIVELIKNGTYANSANFAKIGATYLAAERWQDATSAVTPLLTGGQTVETFSFDTGVSETITDIDIVLEPGETLGVNVTASAVGMTARVALGGDEIQ